MNVISLSWVVMGGCALLVVLAGLALCWQVLLRREAFAALQRCQVLLKHQQARVHQQESDIHELTAGLRAEKAHVEQLQRQVEFAREQAQQLQEGMRSTKDNT